MTRNIAILSLAALLPWGCSTELEVIAPYKNITVVYSLLSTKDRNGAPETIHFVKINKAFLGEGNALEYAQVPDSSEFTDEQLQAEVQQWNGGTLVATYPLNDTIVADRDPGVFFYPEQKLYYFNATLDQNSEYRIVCQARGETVTASTPVVNDFNINGPDGNPAIAMNFIAVAGYATFELNWSSGADGRRYEATYRFNYSDVTAGGDTIPRSFTREMGTRNSVTTDGGESLSAAVNGEDFYQGIANLIPDDPNVVKHIFHGIDLLFAVASDDFHTYLQLGEPITGIVEDRPTFTNVTNGYGLFASRYFKQVIGKELNDNSLEELIDGPYTGHLNFCSGYSAGPPFGCD